MSLYSKTIALTYLGNGQYRPMKESERTAYGKYEPMSNAMDLFEQAYQSKNDMPLPVDAEEDIVVLTDPETRRGAAEVKMIMTNPGTGEEVPQNIFKGRVLTDNEAYPTVAIGQTASSKGEAEIHRIFTQLYHQVEMSDLD